MTFIYVMPLHEDDGYGNIGNGGYGLPPADQTPPNEPAKETPPKNVCVRFLSNCKDKMACQRCKKTATQQDHEQNQEEDTKQKTGCFSCLKQKKEEPVRINIENETGMKPKLWNKMKCCNRDKVRDTSCFPTGKRKDSWVERRESAFGEQICTGFFVSFRPKCSKDCCKGFMRKVFCMNLCCKKNVTEDPISRKASIISKKKSLTPTTAPPPEDTGPKLDMSLIEHTSHMKAAIPVLPICLAWFCLIMNCIAPGTGTNLFSVAFSAYVSENRGFLKKDGPKPRIGSFLINTIIGFGQFFTVLFCLVGWGWSIWWGVIMLKIARKYKKLKHLEAIEEANNRQAPADNQNHHSRDPERIA
ncbi:hypothetical protein NQ318_013160 [Aromia moschata]|uniref:Protein SPEC3 n=1 Tax=Aromia moschata TaxID=1265417 RepID=A0AAV8Y179_9CUCU|nr:hypothetical protein NQ318_013160 [Aromia moschata]